VLSQYSKLPSCQLPYSKMSSAKYATAAAVLVAAAMKLSASNMVHGRIHGPLRNAAAEDPMTEQHSEEKYRKYNGSPRSLIVDDNFKFGPHVKDQCSDPVTVVTNYGTTEFDAKKTRIPPKRSDGTCSTGYCVGDCVTIIITSEHPFAKSAPINVIVGGDLPDPGNCSDVAKKRNDPEGWDFTANGKCGKGNIGRGHWRNCLVHDTCVWARCHDDDAIPGGFSLDGDMHGGNDAWCGTSFDDAVNDYRFAHDWLIECWDNSGCTDPYICELGDCKPKKKRGEYCDDDRDCESDICELFECWEGCNGDRCLTNSD